MAIVRARNPLGWLRRLLLVCGVLGVLGLVVMLAAYRFGSVDLGKKEPAGDDAARPDEQTVTQGQGFDYTQTSEGRRVFRIRAARSQQDRAANAFLETVVLDVFRDDGQTYRVTSNRAQVNENTGAAELEGDVVLSGWEDLELRARGLQLMNGGQVLVSVGAVEFRYPPNLVGRATNLRIDRGADVITMSDGVHIRTTPGAVPALRMDCEQLVYSRGDSVIRALDDVYMKYGDQEISTRSLTLFLNDDQRTLRTLRARWDVRGVLTALNPMGERSRVDFSGQILELEPDPDNPTLRRGKLEGEAGVDAKIKVVDATGLARSLTGNYLESQSVNGQLSIVEGFGDPLTIEEFLDFEPPFLLRQACAHRAVARFLPDGSLAEIRLQHQVELRNEELQLSGGARAVLDAQSGRVLIEGQAVELYNDRGEITSPRITYSRETGVIQADSGVQATLTSAEAFAETPLGQGEGPIRIESKEASWTVTPPTFSFRGAVRAWRGQNLLLADQLRGNEAEQEMAASGNVKTVWLPQRAPGATGAATPIEVTAERLSYRPDESALSYEGKVRVVQEQRTMQCDSLTIQLGDDGATARRMTCQGDVRIDDPPMNRKVQGDLAVYDVPRKVIEVFGEAVRLIDQQNNKLTGKYLFYDLEAGSVKLTSQQPAAPVATP